MLHQTLLSSINFAKFCFAFKWFFNYLSYARYI